MTDREEQLLHALEREFGLPALQILDIINRRNRCKIAVRGAIAEGYLHQYVSDLQQQGMIEGFLDMDQDGRPDFQVTYQGRPFTVECKNVEKQKRAAISVTIDFKRTRNWKDQPERRFYELGEFDVLAACLWNRTGSWEFRFAATKDLTPHPQYAGRLSDKVVVDVAPTPGQPSIWRPDLADTLARL